MPRNYVPAGRARRHARQDMPTGMSSARVVESRQLGGGAQRLLGEQYDVPVPSIAVQTCGTSISLAQQDLFDGVLLTPSVLYPKLVGYPGRSSTCSCGPPQMS